MPRPSVFPRWADTVTADTTRYVEPTAGKKDVGWAAGERPGNQHGNWLFNIIYQWIGYLDAVASKQLTETLVISPYALTPATNAASPISTAWDQADRYLECVLPNGSRIRQLVLPLRFRADDVIGDVRVYVDDAGPNSGGITATLYATTHQAGSGVYGLAGYGSASSTGAGNEEVLTIATGGVPVIDSTPGHDPNMPWQLRITPGAGDTNTSGVTATQKILSIEIDVTRAVA